MAERGQYTRSYHIGYPHASHDRRRILKIHENNELFKSIPIVMLSSEESTTERIRLLEEGAEDYILKPFNPLELKVRIKKIID